MSMDINSYVNSPDIRNHWEKIKYNPTALEAAWLVWQDKNHTLAEKHSAWREIISSTQDVSIGGGIHNIPQPSLHGFLEKFMSLEDRLIEVFYDNDSDAIYSYRMYFDDSWDRDWYHESAIFHSFDEAYEHAQGDGEPPHPNFVEFVKTYIGKEEKQVFVRFNLEKEIVRVDESFIITDEKEYEIYREVFDGIWLSLPTPFTKGDIVQTVRGKYTRPASYDGKFVLTSICTQSNRAEYYKENADGSDMTAHGYFIGNAGDVNHECIHNYMNLEYVKLNLLNEDRLMQPLSAYLKGEIDLALLLGAHRIIICEEQAKLVNNLLNYTHEGKRLAGIKK